MSDLLDEIRDDLQREKYAVLWQKYGNIIIGAAIAVLIITSVAVAGKNYLHTRYEKYSDALFEAATAPEEEAIKKYDEVIANASGTYKAIAGLRKAAILLQSSKNKEAQEVYKQVANFSGAPKELSEVAKLLYITVSMNLAADKELDSTAKAYLGENTSGKGMFKYSGMEISAFQEMQAHNYTKAKDIFNKLLETPDAPQTIKIRAKEMIEAIANIDVGNKNNG